LGRVFAPILPQIFEAVSGYHSSAVIWQNSPMSDEQHKARRQSGQLNVEIGPDLMEQFHRAIGENCHKKKAVVQRLVKLYIEGKIKI